MPRSRAIIDRRGGHDLHQAVGARRADRRCCGTAIPAARARRPAPCRLVQPPSGVHFGAGKRAIVGGLAPCGQLLPSHINVSGRSSVSVSRTSDAIFAAGPIFACCLSTSSARSVSPISTSAAATRTLGRFCSAVPIGEHHLVGDVAAVLDAELLPREHAVEGLVELRGVLEPRFDQLRARRTSCRRAPPNRARPRAVRHRSRAPRRRRTPGRRRCNRPGATRRAPPTHSPWTAQSPAPPRALSAIARAFMSSPCRK